MAEDVSDTFGSRAEAFKIEFVSVGDPGNSFGILTR